MNNNNALLRRKKLVIAMSLALAGATLTGCSDDDDTPITGNTINANGGNGGLTSNGGNGGSLYIDEDEGTGLVEFKKEGKASTGFTRPILPTTANLGSNPLLITEDTTIDAAAPLYSAIVEGSAVSIGQVYMGTDSVLRTAAGVAAVYLTDTLINDNRLYRSNSLPNELLQATGDDAIADPAAANLLYVRDTVNGSRVYLSDGDTSVSDTYYTGLSVAEESTLTLNSNYYCSASIGFDDDINNKGTITREVDGCGLMLQSNSYFGSGDVINSGTTDNIDGGYINLYANIGITNSGNINSSGFSNTEDDGGSAGSVDLYASAYILNTGSISTNGGDGFGYGGSGSDLEITGPIYLENTGTLNSAGGSNTNSAETYGNGGDGGEIVMIADSLLNNTKTAILNSTGGNGNNGGDGGELFVRQDGGDIGALLNAGDLFASGGNSTDEVEGGNGGDGGEVVILTEGPQIQSGGEISSTGGDSALSTGGDGGEVTFFIDYTSEDNGDIVVSGNIDVHGGNSHADNGGQGGDGGEVVLITDGNNGNNEQTISLLGYSSLNFNGGDGGYGGYGPGYHTDDIEINTGTFTNELPINARGGNSLSDGTEEEGGYSAGRGGEVDIYAYNSITNDGAINTSAGENGDYAGRGGQIELDTYQGDVTNTASLLANSSAARDYGSTGGDIDLNSEEGSINNSGSISAIGSNSAFNGGSGGTIKFHGMNVSNSSGLSVKGGSASAVTIEGEEVIEAYGGNGGYIGLTTELLANPVNSGSFTYSAGTGETENGIEGCAKVNFVTQGNCSDDGGDGGEFFINPIKR